MARTDQETVKPRDCEASVELASFRHPAASDFLDTHETVMKTPINANGTNDVFLVVVPRMIS